MARYQGNRLGAHDRSSLFLTILFGRTVINLETPSVTHGPRVSSVQVECTIAAFNSMLVRLRTDFFLERGPKFYVLNHLADLARRRLRRKLLSIQPRKIKDKTVRCSNQELQWFKQKVQMVSKVARNRFVSREKRHICYNGVGSWSIVSTKVLNCSHDKSFRLSIVNR